MTRSFERSSAYVAAAHRVIPGGGHTYAKGDDQYPEHMAPVIVRGRGCRVWDLDGNEFIEFGNGGRAVTLGHGRPEVDEAVARCLADGVTFVRPHHQELVAAERLVDLIPSAEMVKFGVNGSDATSAAIRLARGYTGRDLVAVCKSQPFFSTDDWFIGTTGMPAGIPEAVRRLTRTFAYNDVDGLDLLFQETAGRLAAVVLEAETIEPPNPEFFPHLRALCDRYGVVLVLDEIITGFRWHIRGAQFVHGIEPDLCTFAKGIANGYPLAALAGRRELMQLGGFSADRDRVFLLSQTYGAQPWALAAMHATLDVIESKAVTDRLHATGAALRAAVAERVAAHGLSEQVQLRGRDCNLVYATLDADGLPSQPLRTLLLQELLEQGVLAPSLVVCAAHDEGAVATTVAAFDAALGVYARALRDGVQRFLSGRPVRPALRSHG